MSEVKYSKEHEWIKVEGDIGTIGITQQIIKRWMSTNTNIIFF